VDFDTAQLIGQAIHIAKPKTRLLVSTRKKSMHQYWVELDHRLRTQNIYIHTNKLLAKYQSTTATTTWMEEQAEALDKYITDCMLNAEATIHEHNLNDFSPHKVEMAMMEKFWKLALQANWSNYTIPTQLMKKIINCYPNMVTTGMEEIPINTQQLRDSKEKYREAIAKGKQIRNEFLLKRAEIAHENTTKRSRQQSNSWHI
jgi:hypothetical protein